MDRYIESLLPQDLLQEMELDDRHRSSLGSRSIDSSDFEVGEYLPIFDKNRIWNETILPMCFQYIRNFFTDNGCDQQIEDFLVNEARIQCKFRELKIGDGFPSEDLLRSYSAKQINAINAISEVIDNYLGVEPRRVKILQIQMPKKPVLQSADYFGNSAMDQISKTPLPNFAPSCSSAKEKITVYLQRSLQCSTNISEMRKTLYNCYTSKFKIFNTFPHQLYPKSFLPPNGPTQFLVELTTALDYELGALEAFFEQVTTKSLEINYSFLGENTVQHAQWFRSNLNQLEKINSSLARKTRSKDYLNIDTLMNIPGFNAEVIDHNKKTELLKKELGIYGNILITELSSFIELRDSSSQNCRK